MPSLEDIILRIRNIWREMEQKLFTGHRIKRECRIIDFITTSMITEALALRDTQSQP